MRLAIQRFRFATLTAALIVSSAGCTTTSADGMTTTSPSASVTVADRAQASNALLATALPTNGPGCSAAAGIDGQVVWADARGLADTSRLLTTTTRFDIASVSKQFTATAVLLLAEEGKLALTDPVSMHLPGLPDWAERVSGSSDLRV
jgi:CubicO group peptidase (beta-lactamase class C family)